MSGENKGNRLATFFEALDALDKKLGTAATPVATAYGEMACAYCDRSAAEVALVAVHTLTLSNSHEAHAYACADMVACMRRWADRGMPRPHHWAPDQSWTEYEQVGTLTQRFRIVLIVGLVVTCVAVVVGSRWWP